MEKELTKKVIKVLLKGSSCEHIISFEDKKRLLLGSAEACDVTIVNDTISPIHVVLEYHNGICTLYDMNSRLGTKVNGQKCIKHAIKMGDTIELGTANFKVSKMGEEVETPPPVMPSLKIKPGRKKLPPKAPPKAVVTSEEEVQEYELSYPLSKDPQADFNEYIFEDSDDLYPTFKYDVDKSAVEVIILFQDRIISVDYISDKVKNAYMCGMASSNPNELEYPYLARKSKDLFLEMSETECLLHPLYGHSMATVGGEQDVESAAALSLGFDDIIRFTREDIQIFVRRTDAPPEVANAPVFKDDPELRKYLSIMLIFIFMFMGTTYFFKVDKEVEKEKIPERIATILYKKMPKKIHKKVVKKVIKNKITKKVKQKAKPQQKAAAQKPVASKVKKPSPVVTRKKVKTAPKIARSKKPSRRKAVSKTNQRSKRVVSRNRVRKPTKGRVDVYKSNSFTSSLNSLMAKGGSSGDFQAKVVSSSSGEVGVRGQSARGAFKKADVSSSVGDLSNATVGKLDQGSGVEGIVNKKTIGRASIPVETIAVGMDPNLIRQTLMQYLDQFRYCYQNALDASRNAFSGVVLLDFTIAASGRVSKANATAKRGHLTPQVQSCVINVLRKIPFPAPPGNEIVDVRQPMNFYPKVK